MKHHVPVILRTWHKTSCSVAWKQDLAVSLMNRRYQGNFPEVECATFGLPWHEPKEFRIHFKAGKAADYVSERIWADKQKIEMQDDGSIILHITTRSEPELLAWVRSFGSEAELIR